MRTIFPLLCVFFLTVAGSAFAGPETVTAQQKIADGVGSLPGNSLDDFDFFGGGCVALGDLDGDGIADLAVGASGDDSKNGGNLPDSDCGAVYILFLNADGTIKSYVKIADGFGGLPNGTLPDGAFFGSSCATVGDLDGDEVIDLAVGANGGIGDGAVFILFLNSNGTVKSHQKIADGEGGIASSTIGSGDRFGGSCASAGDLDGDGVVELVVGAEQDDTEMGVDTGSGDNGAVYVLFLDTDGTVKFHQKIADGVGGLIGGTLLDGVFFGSSCALLGDVNYDGLPEFVVGSARDDTADGGGGNRNGAIYVLSLTPDGIVSSHTKIADGENGLTAATLANFDSFGASCTALGDINCDGVVDLAVGATGDDTVGGSPGGGSPGAIHVLFLNADGAVKTHTKIADGLNGLASGTLSGTSVSFGTDCSVLGDLNGDGVIEVAVGAGGEDVTNGMGGGSSNGGVYILSLGDPPVVVTTAVDEIDDPGTGLSLREAIGGITSGDFRRIEFDPSIDGETITLDGTQIELIDQKAAVSGEGLDEGIIISGNNLSRLFRVDSDSSLALKCLTLQDGYADAMSAPQNRGGAIQNLGELNLFDCLVQSNTATGDGGGIDNSTSAELNMRGCTLFNNESTDGYGGGINDSGASWLLNCTFSNNQADVDGGGILRTGAEKTTLAHVTLVGNTAGGEGGGIKFGGAVAASISLHNCIVAENTAFAREDIEGSATTVEVIGNNLIGSNESVESEFSASALVGTATDRVLASLWDLGDFGGKTPTMPPMLSSLALDAGPLSQFPNTDQRSVARDDGTPDLGAVEGAYIPPVVAAALVPDNSAAKAALLKKIKKLKKKAKISKRKGQVAKAKKLKSKIKKLTRKLRAL